MTLDVYAASSQPRPGWVAHHALSLPISRQEEGEDCLEEHDGGDGDEASPVRGGDGALIGRYRFAGCSRVFHSVKLTLQREALRRRACGGGGDGDGDGDCNHVSLLYATLNRTKRTGDAVHDGDSAYSASCREHLKASLSHRYCRCQAYPLRL